MNDNTKRSEKPESTLGFYLRRIDHGMPWYGLAFVIMGLGLNLATKIEQSNVSPHALLAITAIAMLATGLGLGATTGHYAAKAARENNSRDIEEGEQP